MDLKQLEIELNQRKAYPYIWTQKQSDPYDALTRFIYQTPIFSEIQKQIQQLPDPLPYYALNRWLNFWSAKAIEYIFAQNTKVITHTNPYSKHTDFTIEGIAFDHKTSVFPAGFAKDLLYAQQHKRELIHWLYQNQSKQGREHYKNRLFIILFDKNQPHWKLKTEISFIKQEIERYLSDFNKEKLEKFIFNQQEILSDIIWVTR